MHGKSKNEKESRDVVKIVGAVVGVAGLIISYFAFIKDTPVEPAVVVGVEPIRLVLEPGASKTVKVTVATQARESVAGQIVTDPHGPCERAGATVADHPFEYDCVLSTSGDGAVSPSGVKFSFITEKSSKSSDAVVTIEVISVDCPNAPRAMQDVKSGLDSAGFGFTDFANRWNAALDRAWSTPGCAGKPKLSVEAWTIPTAVSCGNFVDGDSGWCSSKAGQLWMEVEVPKGDKETIDIAKKLVLIATAPDVGTAISLNAKPWDKEQTNCSASQKLIAREIDNGLSVKLRVERCGSA